VRAPLMLSTDQTVLWEQFTRKAQAIGATAHRMQDEQSAAELVLATAPRALFTHRLALQRTIMAERLAGPVSVREPIAADVVGAAELAIAETGPVLVGETDDLDRGACFLADRLWLLVAANTIVPTLDMALDRIRMLIQAGNRYVTLMSGPSRTADIERMLTIGVHGPRELILVIVE
jgi:L-lactate dehydrogenase complex protein LldG